jgi:hypothetical protein
MVDTRLSRACPVRMRNDLFSAVILVLALRDDVDAESLLACRATCASARDAVRAHDVHAQRARAVLCRPPSASFVNVFGEYRGTLLFFQNPAFPDDTVCIRRVAGDATGVLRWSLVDRKLERDCARWLPHLFRTGWRVGGWGKAYQRRILFLPVGRGGMKVPDAFNLHTERSMPDSAPKGHCVLCDTFYGL